MVGQQSDIGGGKATTIGIHFGLDGLGHGDRGARERSMRDIELPRQKRVALGVEQKTRAVHRVNAFFEQELRLLRTTK